jgi:hypothetical protein
VPGDPEGSLLYLKVSGSPPPDCGEPMPIGGMLSAADQACIADWIAGLPVAGPDAGGADTASGPGCETCGEASCVDTQGDNAPCSGCGLACPAGATCSAGRCECLGGLSRCGDACVDHDENPDHCGRCDVVCGAQEVCSSGSCQLGACQVGTNCDRACVDTQRSLLHCGGCEQACEPGQACIDGSCGCDPTGASFAEVSAVLTANCAGAGCHSGVRPREGLSLQAGDIVSELVGVTASQCRDGRKLVEPGAPEASYLMHKLLGQSLCSGSQMPKAGQSLSAAEVAAIGAWICAGASAQ